MRKAAIASVVIGLILGIGAGLMAWWITPSYIARMPSDFNKTRSYDGTIRTLFDPAALATGNLAAAIKTGLPATLTENVKVQQTSGNTALLQDTRNVMAAGTPVGHIVSNYAVDRNSLEAVSSHPSDWTVAPAKGLTVSWPLGAKQQNYTGWVYMTYTTTPLKYIKQAQQGGINTYEYQATVPTTPIKNPQVLAALPTSLPISLVPRLVSAGLVSAAQAADLGRIFPGATSIPLGYTYQASNTYFVSPATGLVVNVANVPGTEPASILCAREEGSVLFFGMATSFSAASASFSEIAWYWSSFLDRSRSVVVLASVTLDWRNVASACRYAEIAASASGL